MVNWPAHAAGCHGQTRWRPYVLSATEGHKYTAIVPPPPPPPLPLFPAWTKSFTSWNHCVDMMDHAGIVWVATPPIVAAYTTPLTTRVVARVARVHRRKVFIKWEDKCYKDSISWKESQKKILTHLNPSIWLLKEHSFFNFSKNTASLELGEYSRRIRCEFFLRKNVLLFRNIDHTPQQIDWKILGNRPAAQSKMIYLLLHIPPRPSFLRLQGILLYPDEMIEK